MPDVSVKYHKEKIVDFDESLHQFGLEVIEGGISPLVIYETQADGTLTQVETRKLALAYIKLLEDHLLSQGDLEIGAKLVQGVSTATYQKEKIVELDSSMHRIGFNVVEGGCLNHGFLSYESNYQLIDLYRRSTGDSGQHQVYETETEETCTPADVTKSTLAGLKSFETYL
ncbi:LOW QUALITY PROTEIN: hypothetical protein RJ639_018238, partial [Escallonia herrerae]